MSVIEKSPQFDALSEMCRAKGWHLELDVGPLYTPLGSKSDERRDISAIRVLRPSAAQVTQTGLPPRVGGTARVERRVVVGRRDIMPETWRHKGAAALDAPAASLMATLKGTP